MAMTNTQIVSSIPSTFNETYYLANTPNGYGYIIIDIDESDENYDKIMRQLCGIVFKFYSKIGDTTDYMPIDKATYIINTIKDSAIRVAVPKGSYVTIRAIVDASINKSEILSTYPVSVNILA